MKEKLVKLKNLKFLNNFGRDLDLTVYMIFFFFFFASESGMHMYFQRRCRLKFFLPHGPANENENENKQKKITNFKILKNEQKIVWKYMVGRYHSTDLALIRLTVPRKRALRTNGRLPAPWK